MVSMFMHITKLPLTDDFPTPPVLPRVTSTKHISVVRPSLIQNQINKAKDKEIQKSRAILSQ